MVKKTAIISMKYSPGLYKEFGFMSDRLIANGYSNDLFIADEYRWMIKDDSHKKIFFTGESTLFSIVRNFVSYIFVKKYGIKKEIISEKYSFILFYNFHPVNVTITKFLKKNSPNCKIITYLHEPYMPDKGDYGFKKMIMISIIETLQYNSIKKQSLTIVPSEVALKQLITKYKIHSKRIRVIPLMIPEVKAKTSQKKYFTLIGNDHPAKGYDEFFQLVKLSCKNNLNFQFCLITRSNIESRVRSLSLEERASLFIVNKENISDEEISNIIIGSYALFKLDSAMTQSGIIPLSYQYNTPVIVRNIEGLTQHVKHRNTGYIVNDPIKLDELIAAINHIKLNIRDYKKNIQCEYKKYWSPNNWERFYLSVFDNK